MTVELRKGQRSVNILNVHIVRNDEDKIILASKPMPNEADAKPLHVFIDSDHILSTFEITIDRADATQMRMFVD